MKKIIFLIFCIFFIPLSVIAQVENLTAIENSVFGTDFKKNSNAKRVERLEKHIYGTKKTGDLNTRIQNIQDDIGFSMPVLPKQNQAQSGTSLRDNLNIPLSDELMNMQEDASVDYPIVDKMEEEVFNTTYKKENIYKRLDRLEERVFNKKTNASLNERVNNLASVIVPVKSSSRMPNSGQYSADEINDYYSKSGLETVNDQTIVFQLSVLEQELLKNNYENENIASRLSRLENKIFNRTFPTDNDVSRVQRLMVAYEAKKNSYKYENNRKMQNMAAFSQLGGILLMLLAILL
ncbi:hypothetical protein IJD44_09635 [bacterium]|nr:hypothetical protein [bacterium]